ncbi:hypothetical protein Tsubulata_011752 [Turnera subulata]|uniref:Cation/H+ exchanger transmembrane domain-containing protein n=1 Tax=Turnera subulata TaxID=218843 RepID=A0A9Q0GDT5_9ROSI|nr:hypothetical protein Tsubulata_011752 [Turnera subulata]
MVILDSEVQDSLFSESWHVRGNVLKALVPPTPVTPLVCTELHSGRRTSLFGQILLIGIVVAVSTRIVRFLLKPFRQPKVVSEIIGGVIVGPSLLGISSRYNEVILTPDVRYVVANMGLISFMYFFFTTGVKMDITLAFNSKRKHRIIAFVSMFVPLAIDIVIAIIIRPYMDKEFSKVSSMGAVALSVAVTGFFVMYPILQELNLLSSEVGRMALSVIVVVDLVGILFMILFEAMKQADDCRQCVVWQAIAMIIFLIFTFTVVPQAMMWIMEKTQGQVVHQFFVVGILLAVLSMGFLADMFGLGIITGCMWVGLFTPDGPPIGSIMVERTETLLMGFLMPFGYAFIGMYVDIYSIASVPWSHLAPIFTMTVAGYVSKLLATFGAAMLVKIPWRDALTLSLMLSLRGQLEYCLIMHWMDKRIVGLPTYSLMIVLTTAVSAICTPLITILYDPTRPYMLSKRRTIQHTALGKELKILACVHDHDTVTGLVNLLEIIHPSPENPFSIFALNLIELTGRGNPLVVDHKTQQLPSKYAEHDSIHTALRRYQENRGQVVKLHSFTAVVPKGTMYQDICGLALINEVIFILLPFEEAGMDLAGSPSLVSKVLQHSPCSVGVLVHRTPFQNPLFGPSFPRGAYHFVMLFLGGADAREALAFADKMAMNPLVQLTLIRFLPRNQAGEVELEKKLDDGVIIWFWTRHERNQQVVYREVVVADGEDTLTTIRAINEDHVDLWIMGREQGINPVILQGLADWDATQALGIVGDIVSAVDFSGTASVLVIHQQVMRR